MKKARLVVFASGAGSLFLSLVEAAKAGQLPVTIVGLVVSRPGIGAMEIASRQQIPVALVEKKSGMDVNLWDQKLCETVHPWAPDLVVLAGYTQRLGPLFLQQFKDQVVNIHPSLLPRFGGQGMFGRKVHEAVLKAKELETGVTVHKVTAQYDEGPILAQIKVKVWPDDTPESLEARVKDVERKFYVKVLKDLLA